MGIDSRVLTLAGMWLVILVWYWFMIARPKRKMLKQQKELIDSLQKGDKVVTAGGVYGQITRVSQEYVVLEVARGVELRVARAAIRRRQQDEEQP
jgi:preprotein translocase subunit YajC